MTTATRPEQRCSRLALAAQEDPIGCAIARAHYLVMEVPLPWPFDIEEARHLPASVRELLHGYEHGNQELEFLAIAPDDEYSVAGHTRVLSFRQPAPPFARYERAEYLLPHALAPALAEALCRQPADIGRFAEYLVSDAPARDLLVCTHGTQDACCATFGYPAYRALRHEIAAQMPGVRVWRSSHFGGHRFAPTLLDFPEARYWGWLDDDATRAIIHRTGPIAALRRHYRGWAGLGFFAQVAEREIFEQIGWEWIDYVKSGAEVASEMLFDVAYPLFEDDMPPPATVRIDYAAPDGQRGAYTATVECTGQIQTGGECGDGLSAAWQFSITQLERVKA